MAAKLNLKAGTIAISYYMLPVMVDQVFLAIWGCIPELSSDCVDMTNSSSTYLGIVAGAIVGGVVSWWVYNRQKKTAETQDELLNKIAQLEERHDEMLARIEALDRRHDAILNALLKLGQNPAHDKSAASADKK
jgi:hypothetical protein